MQCSGRQDQHSAGYEAIAPAEAFKWRKARTLRKKESRVTLLLPLPPCD
jgi:hypothetical protein